jgi:hypothetical protein
MRILEAWVNYRNRRRLARVRERQRQQREAICNALWDEWVKNPTEETSGVAMLATQSHKMATEKGTVIGNRGSRLSSA